MHDLTPREIVTELDRYIIGQDNAKRAVAVAVRNRWRRRRLDDAMAREVAPKNIIMIGPTGVGKTEIARRLASLVNAPFLKVEASKYTEVGYHGRDVESMVRDLVELALGMARDEQAAIVREQAEAAVEERLVALLMGDRPTAVRTPAWSSASATGGAAPVAADAGPDLDEHEKVRTLMKKRLRDGYFDEREIEIDLRERQAMPMIGMMGPDQLDPAVTSMLENLMPDRTRTRRVTVSRARHLLLEEETDKLLDNEKLTEQAIERAEQSGIIFLDEIDKVAAAGDARH
jgi:ATP-dependent HslUV protease ATP-binding subunit HslU